MAKDLSAEKALAAKEAVKFLKDGQTVGLGTGSTAEFALHEIAKLVKQGMRLTGIPTSIQTGRLASSLGISLADINSLHSIDITIDGADEFTPQLVLIKGGGGALLREKIVASFSKQVIIIADSSKKVAVAGKFKLPVEVIPFASGYVLQQLELLGGKGVIRAGKDGPFSTDQGNHIIDADFGLIHEPAKLSARLNGIAGLVAHGLFIRLASRVIMGNDGNIVIFE